MGIKGGTEGELVVEVRAGVRVGDEVRVSRIAAEAYVLAIGVRVGVGVR